VFITILSINERGIDIRLTALIDIVEVRIILNAMNPLKDEVVFVQFPPEEFEAPRVKDVCLTFGAVGVFMETKLGVLAPTEMGKPRRHLVGIKMFRRNKSATDGTIKVNGIPRHIFHNLFAGKSLSGVFVGPITRPTSIEHRGSP
jgi:hypothetical protein